GRCTAADARVRRAMWYGCGFLFSSRRRHTRLVSDWSSDVCSSDLQQLPLAGVQMDLDAPGAPAEWPLGHESFWNVAHRPNPCIASVSRSISSREPVATTARPFSWTSRISRSAFAVG